MISKASIDNIQKQKITKHYYERVVTIFSYIVIEKFSSGNLQETGWNGSQTSVTLIF